MPEPTNEQLDRFLAENAMRWRLVGPGPVRWWVDGSGTQRCREDAWKPSSDLNQAFQVLQARLGKYRLMISTFRSDGEIRVEMPFQLPVEMLMSGGDTPAALSICTAVAKAHEWKGPYGNS